MNYLRLRRAQLILASFLIASLLFVLFPEIDLGVARMLFDDGFYLRGAWTALAHDSVLYFLGLTLFSVVGLYVYNRFFGRNLCGIDGRKVSYLLLVLILGAGLIVNGVFKDDFGRARPRDIVEFGGTKRFTPAFVISRECDRNCSFSSGDGAGAFFSVALALALSRRRAVLLAALRVWNRRVIFPGGLGSAFLVGQRRLFFRHADLCRRPAPLPDRARA